jgi:hypothetical protein
MYNYKHYKTWDKSLSYIQCDYNSAQHSSIGRNTFEICYGFQLFVPNDLVNQSIVSTTIDYEQKEIDKALKFRDKFCEIHKQAQQMLKTTC